MFIRLDKEDEFYRSGETVKGTVFFELYHQSAQNELFIKFEGVQIVPAHVKKRIMGGEDSSMSESSVSDEPIISIDDDKVMPLINTSLIASDHRGNRGQSKMASNSNFISEKQSDDESNDDSD
jgi:hypothetical protein